MMVRSVKTKGSRNEASSRRLKYYHALQITAQAFGTTMFVERQNALANTSARFGMMSLRYISITMDPVGDTASVRGGKSVSYGLSNPVI